MAPGWEYFKTSLLRGAQLDDPQWRLVALEEWRENLNILGQDGWELVAEQVREEPGNVWYSGTFKRPL